MTKKIFTLVCFIFSILAFLSLIANNIFSFKMGVIPSVLFVIPGSISLGNILFFASRLFLKEKSYKLFNKIALWQVGVFAALSVAAPFVSASSVAISWSWIIGVAQIMAQIVFLIHCSYLTAKKQPKRSNLILSLVFVGIVLAVVTTNYILNVDPEFSLTAKILDITSNVLKNLQFISLGAYIIYEKA